MKLGWGTQEQSAVNESFSPSLSPTRILNRRWQPAVCFRGTFQAARWAISKKESFTRKEFVLKASSTVAGLPIWGLWKAEAQNPGGDSSVKRATTRLLQEAIAAAAAWGTLTPRKARMPALRKSCTRDTKIRPPNRALPKTGNRLFRPRIYHRCWTSARFYFIPRALSVEEQFHWIRESLTSFPQPPNRTNHNAVYGPISDLWPHVQEQHVLVEDTANDMKSFLAQREIRGPRADGERDENHDDCLTAVSTSEVTATETPYAQEDVWHNSVILSRTFEDNALMARVVHEKPEESCTKWRFADEAEARSSLTATSSTKLITAESLLRKLRWTTIGQQFDWGKKCYNTMLPYKRLPEELSELSARLAEPAMNGEKFLAQGAIVNYYRRDDMLGGHIDDMEADWSKPIVSISLGCKAVFLLGGKSKEDAPLAMFLRSGDVVLMAGPARRCFHGVPRIFDDPSESEVPDFSTQVKVDKSLWAVSWTTSKSLESI